MAIADRPADRVPSTTSSKITRDPLPRSRKVFVEGSDPSVRVPMREIELSPTRESGSDGSEGVSENPPFQVYDTSGPYTDPSADIDVTRGLAPLRSAWIEARRDSEQLDRPSSTFGVSRLGDARLDAIRFAGALPHAAPRPGDE